jgi:hypothetical protein
LKVLVAASEWPSMAAGSGPVEGLRVGVRARRSSPAVGRARVGLAVWWRNAGTPATAGRKCRGARGRERASWSKRSDSHPRAAGRAGSSEHGGRTLRDGALCAPAGRRAPSHTMPGHPCSAPPRNCLEAILSVSQGDGGSHRVRKIGTRAHSVKHLLRPRARRSRDGRFDDHELVHRRDCEMAAWPTPGPRKWTSRPPPPTDDRRAWGRASVAGAPWSVSAFSRPCRWTGSRTTTSCCSFCGLS